MADKHKLENLVCLIWASNECYTDVVTVDFVSNRMVQGGEMGEKPYMWSWGELQIDLVKGTWKQKKKHGKIGDHFEQFDGHIWSDYRYGLIGVYDRSNLGHLKSMIRDSQEATEDRHGGWD